MVLQIPDLYGCIETPSWASQHFYVLVVFGTLAFLALVLLLYRAYTRYCEARKPCWVVALKKIRALSTGSGPLLSDGKCFYAGLTDVLKWYCYRRFGWQLLGKTEGEIVGFLKQSDVDVAFLDQLEKCMLISVQVKFARVLVSVEQAEIDRQAVISFIEQSIPVRAQQ